jgi:hypothetical protein
MAPAAAKVSIFFSTLPTMSGNTIRSKIASLPDKSIIDKFLCFYLL